MSHTQRPQEAIPEANQDLTELLVSLSQEVQQWTAKHPGSYFNKVQTAWETMGPAAQIQFMAENTLSTEMGKNAIPFYNMVRFHGKIKNALHVRRSDANAISMDHFEPVHIKIFASLGILPCPENASFLEGEAMDMANILQVLTLLARNIPKLGPTIHLILEKFSQGTSTFASLANEVLPRVRQRVREENNSVQTVRSGMHEQLNSAAA